MAQRTVHMLLGNLVSNKITLTDKNRFLIGNILADAYIKPEQRSVTHFIKHDYEENTVYFDFSEFLCTYKNEIMCDDLYLGYYAHLVEDAFYRYYLYYEKSFLKSMKSYELTILHQDYAILNSYISNKWVMPEPFSVSDFEKERMNEIIQFDIDKIVSDYQSDLQTNIKGEPTLLKKSILDEFITKYTDKLSWELNSIRQMGVSQLNVLDYKWENKR